MISQSFEYCRPQTLFEAFALLKQHGDAAKILSGGQSLEKPISWPPDKAADWTAALLGYPGFRRMPRLLF